ncbi:helix-turn-helix domain-containing protein [Arenimonas oryziterrae]
MWSTLLLAGSLHGLVVAGLLWAAPRNRLANRFLATLLVTVVLLITPYTIGYAGFYDAWPWLSFAPLYWQLAFGPLLYFYVRSLGDPVLPAGWRWHFLPALVQGAYYGVAFCLPLQTKWVWNDSGHLSYVMPALNALTLVSVATYWTLALRRHRNYQAWLEANSGQREELRLGWLRGFLWAVAVVVVLNLGFQVVDTAVTRLDYFDYFPFYLVLSLLVYYLGIEGWRHAGLRFPPMQAASVEPAADAAGERDWRALGERWAAQVAAAGWWREPELSLADLARHLGTNSNYLSRALNEGLGQSFSDFINRLRVEEAQRRLLGPGEVLAIALDVGFGSKASFNRAFRACTGQTPTAWRAEARRSI